MEKAAHTPSAWLKLGGRYRPYSCEDLILMRDGNVLAHEPPSHLLRRSGTDDLESAFLKLVNSSVPESDTTTREGAATAPTA
jgi:hypothetical protein